jgi:hypothetical protein
LRDLSDRLELTALQVEIDLVEVFARLAFPGSTPGSSAADAS